MFYTNEPQPLSPSPLPLHTLHVILLPSSPVDINNNKCETAYERRDPGLLDVVRGGGDPGLRNFQFTPLSYCFPRPFFCRAYRNVGQKKAREGMQQAHGKKKRGLFKGTIVPIPSSHEDLQPREHFQRARKGKRR